MANDAHPPIVRLTPFSIKPYVDFGEVIVGQRACRKLILENPKDEKCEVQVTAGNSGTFQLLDTGTSNKLTIEPKNGAEISLEWAPKVAGHSFEILRLRASTVKSEIMVKLAGVCLPPPAVPKARFNMHSKVSVKAAGSRMCGINRSAVKTRGCKRVVRPKAPVLETPGQDQNNLNGRRGPKAVETPGGLRRRDLLTGLVVISPNSSSSSATATRTYVKRRSTQNCKRDSAPHHNKTFTVKKQIFEANSPAAPAMMTKNSENLHKKSPESLKVSQNPVLEVSPISKPISSSSPNLPQSSTLARSTTQHQISEDEGFKDGSTMYSSSSFGHVEAHTGRAPNNQLGVLLEGPKPQHSSVLERLEVRDAIILEIRNQFQEQLELIRKEIGRLSVQGCGSSKGGTGAVDTHDVATSTDDFNFMSTAMTKGDFHTPTEGPEEADKTKFAELELKGPTTLTIGMLSPKATPQLKNVTNHVVTTNLRRKKLSVGKLIK